MSPRLFPKLALEHRATERFEPLRVARLTLVKATAGKMRWRCAVEIAIKRYGDILYLMFQLNQADRRRTPKQ